MVKLLSALAVLLVIPTILASFYGMNVTLPLADHPAAGWTILAVSTMAVALAAAWFWHRRWL